MKTTTLLSFFSVLLLLQHAVLGQTKPAPKLAPAKVAAAPTAKPAATVASSPAAAAPAPATAAAPPALITDKMVDPTPNTDVLKVRIESNPVTKRLTVRTNATGPTRVEVNGTDGRPVLTRDMISGDAAAVLDVSNLPAGSYIVQCTSGERRGMKRVIVGQ